MLTCNLFQHTCFSCLKSTFFILSYQLHCCWLDDPHRFPGPTHSTGGRGVDVMTMTMAGGGGGGPGTWNIYIYMYVNLYIFFRYTYINITLFGKDDVCLLLPASCFLFEPSQVDGCWSSLQCRRELYGHQHYGTWRGRSGWVMVVMVVMGSWSPSPPVLSPLTSSALSWLLLSSVIFSLLLSVVLFSTIYYLLSLSLLFWWLMILCIFFFFVRLCDKDPMNHPLEPHHPTSGW